MSNFSGNVFQKAISKVFPSSVAANTAEILFLLLMGMLAITLHARLRIPMHLPGKQGILFMLIIVMARSLSKYSFATSIACFGASFILFFNVLGFNDPFMPIIYIMLGVVMDILFGLIDKFKPSVILIGLASGLSWTTIPFLRIIIGFFTGFPFHSLLTGVIFPLFTHFLFGMIGGLIGASIIYSLNKKQKAA